MKKLIVIADWANDTLTCQEIASAVEGFLKNPEGMKISFISSTPSTINTSFLLSQVVESEERYGRPQNTVIFENTDPRLQTRESVKKAKGAEFIIVKLKSGIFLCGPNAGFNFSLVKDKIDEIFHYEGLDKGSQFRSRDLYSRVSAHLMDSLEDELDLTEVRTDEIPTPQGYFIGHIDNYGNIKTTIRGSNVKGQFEYGDTVTVTINEITKKAKYVDNLFGGTPGELVLYPGSSGKADDPYLEVSVWRHFTEKNPTTGLDEFKHPRPGMEIFIK